MHRAVAAICGISLFGSSAAAAPRQPTGKWVVDFDKDECLLERDYGTQSQPLMLLIERFPMETGLSISVFSATSGKGLEHGQAKVVFGTAAPIKAGYSAYALAGVHLRRFSAQVEDGNSLIANAVAGGVVEVNAPDEVKETFAVPGLGDALKILDNCVLDLGKSWGVPVDQQQRMRIPAKAIRHDYLQSNDYPTKELNEGANGRSLVRLTVDESGKPVDCVPLKSVESPDFARTTCRLLLSRASFHPALDSDGKPMRSVYVYNVNWIVAG